MTTDSFLKAHFTQLPLKNPKTNYQIWNKRKIFSHNCKNSLKDLRLCFFCNANLPQKGWNTKIIMKNLACSGPSTFQFGKFQKPSHTMNLPTFHTSLHEYNSLPSLSSDIKQFCVILTILIMRTISKTPRGTSGHQNLAWHWVSGVRNQRARRW